MFNMPINILSLLFKSLLFNSSASRTSDINDEEERILKAPSVEQTSLSTLYSIQKHKCESHYN